MRILMYCLLRLKFTVSGWKVIKILGKEISILNNFSNCFFEYKLSDFKLAANINEGKQIQILKTSTLTLSTAWLSTRLKSYSKVALEIGSIRMLA